MKNTESNNHVLQTIRSTVIKSRKLFFFFGQTSILSYPYANVVKGKIVIPVSSPHNDKYFPLHSRSLTKPCAELIGKPVSVKTLRVSKLICKRIAKNSEFQIGC